MIGMVLERARTRFATRWVKSGLSMMIKASGFADMTASAVSPMRRRIFGKLAGIAPKPMIARSPNGKRLGTPAAAVAPPTQENCARPLVRCLIAATSAHPADHRILPRRPEKCEDSWFGPGRHADDENSVPIGQFN